MDNKSSSKPSFFQKSPEISFAESPALSFLKGANKGIFKDGFFGGNDGFSLTKKMSNGLCIPSCKSKKLFISNGPFDFYQHRLAWTNLTSKNRSSMRVVCNSDDKLINFDFR